MIAGAGGRLGRALVRACRERGIACIALGRTDLDCADRAAVAEAMERHRPWGVINAAGYVRVDDAESEPERCMRENVAVPIHLAEACGMQQVPLLTFSSALVFDGDKGDPYLENDRPSPLGTYAWSKATAERRVLELLPSALIVRTSSFFGHVDDGNFIARALRTFAAGERFTAADDQVISPSYLPDLVHASLDLLIDGERGIWHLAHGEGLSWADLAARIAALAGFDRTLVDRVPSSDLGLTAPRPAYSVLGSTRGGHLPPLESALRRYIERRG
jgi:dTDP-4-dehydrorhamnose reductase